jgi:radical SAM superfamily enzyme YgiQ (UPF0313 family)
LTAWQNNQTCVRTLDNRIIKKWTEHSSPDSWRSIRELEETERKSLLEEISQLVGDLTSQLERGDLAPVVDSPNEGQAREAALDCLRRISAWVPPRYEEQKARFDTVYSPVGILPPDQYYSIVLQATVGCHWNRCTFCDFYRQVKFHIKTPEEFRMHMHAVKAFLGEGIRLRKSIFLGDANALVTPQEKLLAIFDLIHQEFPIVGNTLSSAQPACGPIKGIYSFLDVFTGEKKSLSNFRDLKAQGLKRVYVGIETGCDELLRFLNKPASSAQTLDVVSEIKEADINVGVILLIGVGGSRYLEPHVVETTDLLNALQLGKGDLIYFSPLWDSPTSDYFQQSLEAGIRGLTDEEKRNQVSAIRSGLHFAEGQKPKIALYDIREFVY